MKVEIAFRGLHFFALNKGATKMQVFMPDAKHSHHGSPHRPVLLCDAAHLVDDPSTLPGDTLVPFRLAGNTVFPSKPGSGLRTPADIASIKGSGFSGGRVDTSRAAAAIELGDGEGVCAYSGSWTWEGRSKRLAYIVNWTYHIPGNKLELFLPAGRYVFHGKEIDNELRVRFYALHLPSTEKIPDKVETDHPKPVPTAPAKNTPQEHFHMFYTLFPAADSHTFDPPKFDTHTEPVGTFKVFALDPFTCLPSGCPDDDC